jgi:hypothetical protein
VRLSLACVMLPTLLLAQESGPARLVRAPVSLAMPPVNGPCLVSLDVIVDRAGSVQRVKCLFRHRRHAGRPSLALSLRAGAGTEPRLPGLRVPGSGPPPGTGLSTPVPASGAPC